MTDNDPSKCSSCDHKVDYPSDEGYCYMFKDPPKDICLSHTSRKSPGALPVLRNFFDTVFVEKGQK